MIISVATNRLMVHHAHSLESFFVFNIVMSAKDRPELIVKPAKAVIELIFSSIGNRRIMTLTSWYARPTITKVDNIMFSIALGFFIDETLIETCQRKIRLRPKTSLTNANILLKKDWDYL